LYLVREWRRCRLQVATRAQARQDLFASATTEEEDAEGIDVERVCDEVANGSGVFTGIGPVWAGAPGLQLAWSREQIEADSPDVVGDTGRQLALKERRSVANLSRERIEQPVPFRLDEHPHPNPHLVGGASRTLHLGENLTRSQRQLSDRAGTGIGPPSRKAVRIELGALLECLNPSPAPPGCAKGTATRSARSTRSGKPGS
jgi:hypothetical protein